MRQAIWQTNTFAASMRRTTLSMTRFGASMLGVGSVTAALYGMTRLFKQFGDLADISDMLSINTKSLIGFQLAAKEAGVSAEELETSIRFLLKTVGEKALTGESVAGLDARGLLGLPTEEVFLRVADAISKIPSRAIRATAEVKAFGRAGAKLDVLFRGGRSELEKYVEVVGKLGTGLTRLEVGRLDIVVEDMNRLFEAYKGLALTIATKLAPAIDNQINITTLGVMAVTQSLKGLKRELENVDLIGRPELLPESSGFLFGIRAQKFLTQAEWTKRRQQMLMGPPSPMPESDFDRRVREDMERKQQNAAGAGGTSGNFIGMVNQLGGGMRRMDAVDIALSRASSNALRTMAGIRAKSTTGVDTSITTGMGNPRVRDNPLLDRLGRDLHAVVVDEFAFRKEHGGRGRTGEEFGANISGWRDPDFPKNADAAMVQQQGILSEMRLIREEGNLSREQLRAQREMLAALKRIEQNKGGMKP